MHSPAVHETCVSQVSRAEFEAAFGLAWLESDAVSRTCAMFGAHDTGNIGARCFLTSNRRAGYVLHCGDLRHVFALDGGRGTGSALVTHAVAQGARTLDCYAVPHLLALYGRHGFKVTRAELPWPDSALALPVVWMSR